MDRVTTGGVTASVNEFGPRCNRPHLDQYEHLQNSLKRAAQTSPADSPRTGPAGELGALTST